MAATHDNEKNNEMMEALMALCHEKHIDELYLLDRLEQSLAKSYADLDPDRFPDGAKVTIDRTSGRFFLYRLVPEGEPDPETGEYTEFREEAVDDPGISRIAALHAKSEIAAITRNAARQMIYEEFSERVGDIITGTVIQSVPDFTIIKIREGIEAELPHFDLRKNNEERQERNERPAGERYRHGDRIKALIIEVRDPQARIQPVRGEFSRPSSVVSRSHPDLLRRLFELEVPEIYDGVVEIESIAREPGRRSKVAVSSLDDRLDPVGACVGPKGSRVRTVVSELRGERVDVVLWSDDPAKRVANALSPAKVTRVIVDPEHTYATVIVPDDQLSLAIGKEGQNARLAARLTGYHIDIKSEGIARDLIAKMRKKAEAAEDLIDQDQEQPATRCAHVSENGTQCRNMARPGSKYCGVHEAAAEGESLLDREYDAIDTSDDPDSLI